MTKEAMKLALDALENSIDLVREDAYEAEKLYGNYPTRQGKVKGLKVLADDHEKAITTLREALAEQPAYRAVKTFHEGKAVYVAEQPTRLPFGVGGGLVAIKTLLSRDPCVHANTAIQMIDAILAEQPAPMIRGDIRDGLVDDEPALAEQPAQQEPVAHFGSAYVNENGVHITTVLGPVAIPQDAKLYTSPPAQRTWVSLTDDEITDMWAESSQYYHEDDFARAIEAKIRSKNT